MTIVQLRPVDTNISHHPFPVALITIYFLLPDDSASEVTAAAFAWSVELLSPSIVTNLLNLTLLEPPSLAIGLVDKDTFTHTPYGLKRDRKMIISLCTIAAGILLLVWIASALLAHHWQPLARSLGTVGVPLPPKTDSVTSAADLAVSRRDAAPSPLCERCASPKLVVQLTEAIAWLEALNVLSASRTSADACASAPGGSLEAPSQPIRYELPPGEDFVMVTYQQSWCVNDWGLMASALCELQRAGWVHCWSSQRGVSNREIRPRLDLYGV